MQDLLVQIVITIAVLNIEEGVQILAKLLGSLGKVKPLIQRGLIC